MINKLQSLKGKTKLNFQPNLGNYYDEKNIERQMVLFILKKMFLVEVLKVLLKFLIKY